jgi:predicted nuclease with TOPRIM domain
VSDKNDNCASAAASGQLTVSSKIPITSAAAAKSASASAAATLIFTYAT